MACFFFNTKIREALPARYFLIKRRISFRERFVLVFFGMVIGKNFIPI